MEEEFVIIGQHMVDEGGVVLLVAEPIEVHMRETVTLKTGAQVVITAAVKPGYKKYRAATFAEAMAMYQRTLELEQS